MNPHEPRKEGADGRSSNKFSLQARKKLEKFLSSICESKGLSSSPAPKSDKAPAKRISCRCPCAGADWRAQLDVPGGVICIHSKVTRKDEDGPHRDITLAVTYLNDEGKEDYADITFCDSEIRWIMEALWHAPIWD